MALSFSVLSSQFQLETPDPFPRKVLISGEGIYPFVKESLKHFAVTSIFWVDESSQDLNEGDDILKRISRFRKPIDGLFDSQNLMFDVIILSQPPRPSELTRAATRLSAGGVMAIALPTPWTPLLHRVWDTFKHTHIFKPQLEGGIFP
jgi:hypothetical protein